MSTIQNPIPVTLVKGFLEAGKSTYINKMLQNESAHTTSTLLLCFEEGEVSFDPNTLKNCSVILEEINDEVLLNRNYLEQLSSLHSPSRIIVEYNSMWKMQEFEFPHNWNIVRRISILSGNTLGIYLDNMRAFMGPMLSRCDQIIINRCDNLKFLSSIKRKLRPLLDDPSNVIIESQGKEYPFDVLEDLPPYSLDAEQVTISADDYVYWFYDCQDYPDRYEGKHLLLQGNIKKSPVLKDGEFAFGKIAITCCEADMSFLGYIAHFESIDDFPNLSDVQVEAIIQYRYQKQYQKVMPYLKIIHMEQRKIS